LVKGTELDVDANLALIAGEKRKDFREFGAEEEEGKDAQIGTIFCRIRALRRKRCPHDRLLGQI
jgi:hypothetical protein